MTFSHVILILAAIIVILIVNRVMRPRINHFLSNRQQARRRQRLEQRFEAVFGFPHPQRSAHTAEQVAIKAHLERLAIQYLTARRVREAEAKQFKRYPGSPDKLDGAILDEMEARVRLEEAHQLASPHVIECVYPDPIDELIKAAETRRSPRRRTTSTQGKPTPINRSA